MTEIFLSYARDDDEAFVAALHARLQSEGFSVWRDRTRMPSRALTFLREIRDAISHADRFVVVLGPAAVASDYVRAEFQHALAASKAVTPVLRIGTFDSLPAELRGLHAIDCREGRQPDAAFAEVIRVLREPVAALGPLWGEVPVLPPHFQPRPEILTRIAERVLRDERQPVTLDAGERVTVLNGMGGIGKTVLAASFARSTAARRAFPDGVYWISADADTGPVETIRRLGGVLNDPSARASDASTGTSLLRAALAERVALVVIDNAWKLEQIDPILQAAAPTSRIVLTTRDASIATAAGLGSIELPLLSKEAALRHLADWISGDPADLPHEAVELARECGFLPFALALNGAMIEDGNTWRDLLDALRNADLRYAEQTFPGYSYPNVLRSIDVSVEALRRDYPWAVERYRELGAFLGAGIPEAAIAMLWHRSGNLSGRASRKLLGILERRALIRCHGRAPHRTVTLHDLLRDYVRGTSDERATLNESLLAAYAAQCLDGWPSGPADGYFHQHLVAHLVESGDAEQVHALLDTETSDGRNAWYDANEAIGNIDGYANDVGVAWDHAERQAKALSSHAIAREAHYALLMATLHSVATNLPTDLIAALVEIDPGRWTNGWVLAQAARASPDKRRAETLASVVSLLRPAERFAALEIGMRIVDPRWRAQALTRLAPHLDGDDRANALTAAQTSAEAIRSEQWWQPGLGPSPPPAAHDRALAMGELSAQLSDPDREALFQDALATTNELEPSPWHVIALAELVRWAPTTQREATVHEAIIATTAVGYIDVQAQALAAIADAVTAAQYPLAFETALSIPDDVWRSHALAALAARAPEGYASVLLEESKQVENLDARSEVLANLLPRLGTEDRERGAELALEAARTIDWNTKKAGRLLDIATHLDPLRHPSLVDEAWRVLSEDRSMWFDDGWNLIRRMARSQGFDPSGMLQEALVAARALAADERTYALTQVGAALEGEARRAAILEALGAATTVGDEYAQRKLILAGASAVPEASAIAERARTIQDAEAAWNDESTESHGVATGPATLETVRDDAIRHAMALHDDVDARLSHVVSELLTEAERADDPLPWCREALSLVMASDLVQPQTLRELASTVPEVMVDEVAAAIRNVPDPMSRAYGLVHVAQRLRGSARTRAGRDARMALATADRDDTEAARILIDLVGVAPKGVLKECEAIARRLTDPWSRVAALLAIAAHGGADGRDGLLTTALADARALTDAHSGAMALAKVASAMTGPDARRIRAEALTRAWTIEPVMLRFGVLALIGSQMSIDERPILAQQIVEAAATVPDQDIDGEELESILHNLAPGEFARERRELISSTVLEVCEIEDLYQRTGWLAAHVPKLMSLPPADMHAVWCDALRMLAARPRFHLLHDLAELVPVVSELGGYDAVVGLITTSDDVRRWFP